MNEAPRCFGTYDEEDSESCSDCEWLTACKARVGRITEKKKKKDDAGLTGEDKEFIDSLTLISSDPISRLVRLRREAIGDGDRQLLAVLNRAIMVNVEGMGKKSTEFDPNMLLGKLLDKDSGSEELKKLSLYKDIFASQGKSDIEAAADSLSSTAKEGFDTLRVVYGPTSLASDKRKALEDPKTAAEFTRCGVCGLTIHHSNPKACPNCGATSQTAAKIDEIEHEEKGEVEEVLETEEEPEAHDCFGTFEAGNAQCNKCFQTGPCKAETEQREITPIPFEEQPLPPSAKPFLRDIHRIAGWAKDGHDPIEITTALYKVSRAAPTPKNLAKVKWSLFSSEIGLTKLLELAGQYEKHPEAEEHQIPLIIDVLSTQKGRGWVHASQSQLNMLAKKDGVVLTDEDRMEMIEQVNARSPYIKLDPDDYIKGKGKTPSEPADKDKGEPEKTETDGKAVHVPCPIPGCKVRRIRVENLEAHLHKYH